MFTVFGAKGWIGSALARHLKRGGHQVAAISRENWPDPGASLGHVVYTIGHTADFRGQPLAVAEAHVSRLIEALNSFRYESFLYLSSTRIYRHALYAAEDTALPVQPTDPDEVYNITKLAGESVCLSLADATVRVARLANVIGPQDRSNNFLSAVLAEMRRDGFVTIRSSPDSAKDYIALEDVVALLAQIALHGRHRIYNVASGRNVSNRLLADLIQRHTGARVAFTENAPHVVFPPIVVERIRAEFDANPTPFETILVELLQESADTP